MLQVSPFRSRTGLSITIIPMGIFRALGFGLFLIILASLMPAVFSELSLTVVTFLQSSAQAFVAAGILASYAGHIPPSPL
jgi:hypothetical protein